MKFKLTTKHELGEVRHILGFAWWPIQTDTCWVWLEGYMRTEVYSEVEDDDPYPTLYNRWVVTRVWALP